MRATLAISLLASACGGTANPTNGRDAGVDASTHDDSELRVCFLLGDEAEAGDVDRLLLSVGEVRIDSDVGDDERLRDETWRLVEPLTEGADQVLFPLVPPGTYSRLEVRIVTPPLGAGLPADFTPADSTAVVRGTREDVPVHAASARETTWDLRCDTGVKLPPGGRVDLVVELDVDAWLEDGIDDEELDDAARLHCEEGGGDSDADSDRGAEGTDEDAGTGD